MSKYYTIGIGIIISMVMVFIILSTQNRDDGTKPDVKNPEYSYDVKCYQDQLLVYSGVVTSHYMFERDDGIKFVDVGDDGWITKLLVKGECVSLLIDHVENRYIGAN